MNPISANGYAQIDGLRMYYEASGEGTPLLLLHAGTVTSQMWTPYLPAFTTYFQVIAPDSRGHGRTSHSTEPFSYARMADDMVDFVQTLGLQKPLICGYSDGGQIALEMAMRYPGLAQAYIVGAAYNQVTPGWRDFLQHMGINGPDLVDTQQTERALPEFVQRWRERHDTFHGTDYWKTFITQLSTMWLTSLDYNEADFQRISEPTLILVGDRDMIASIDQAVAMYKTIPQAELAVLPDADHFFIFGQSTLFIDIALDFLQRHLDQGGHPGEK